MSDPLPNPDELVSAYLDGETTPAEAALVEQDAALMTRVEELRAARDAVARPVPPLSTTRREQIIGAAMASADQAAASGVVVPLRRFPQPILAAAAAVAALAAVVGAGLLASRLGGDDYADEASGAPTTASADYSDSGTDDAAPEMADMAEPAAEEEPAAEMEATMGAAMAEAPASEAAPEAAEAREAAPEAAEAREAAPEAAEEPADEMAMADDDIEDSLADGATTAASQPEADAGTSYEEDPGREGESAATAPVETAPGIPLIDLGVVDSIDALVDLISTRPGAAGESSDQPGEPGSCSEAVRDHVQKIGANPISSFAAVLDGPTPASLDAQLVVRDDGTTSVLYAIEPDCAPGILSLDETNG